jgi:hypothetical protein
VEKLDELGRAMAQYLKCGAFDCRVEENGMVSRAAILYQINIGLVLYFYPYINNQRKNRSKTISYPYRKIPHAIELDKADL